MPKGIPKNGIHRGWFQKGHKMNLGKHHSEETKKKLSKAHTGKKFSQETRQKISLAKMGTGGQKGRHWKLSQETRQKISNATRGSKNHFWKGGITPIHLIIRRSLNYRLWRKSVFERDNYACIWCGQRGGKLNADHIKPFSLFPELRFAIDNGRTLCVDCHKKTDTYGEKVKKFIYKNQNE